jgi:hypothetical protein
MTTPADLPVNLALWARYYTPPKDALKDFTRSGGFRGTAIDPMWAIRCATEEWGPMGDKWGLIVNSEEFVTFDAAHVLHISCCSVFYPAADGGDEGTVATVPCVGQTWAVSQSKSGPLFDEEVVKKSRTDALSKGLSWLGFGAAVHMGAFDGCKYSDLPENAPPEASRTDARAQAQAQGSTDPAPEPEPRPEPRPSPAKTVALALWTADKQAVCLAANSADERTAKNHALDSVRVIANRLGIDLKNHPSNDEMEALERETSAMIHAAASENVAAEGGN